MTLLKKVVNLFYYKIQNIAILLHYSILLLVLILSFTNKTIKEY